MEWVETKKSLEVMKTPPTTNSPLRKKLALVKKLKSVSVEDFPQLLSEIKKENLKKFYSEIINGLLVPSRAQTDHDIRSITTVIYFFSGDAAFMAALVPAYRRHTYSGWIQCGIVAEVHALIYGSMKEITRELLSHAGREKLVLIKYILESFEERDDEAIESVVRQELAEISDMNIEALQEICQKLGWDEHPELPTNYKEVVKEEKGEFSFYTRAPSRSRGRFEVSDIKKIEFHADDVNFLDDIGANIVDSSELVQRVIKKRKHRELIPAVARILTHTKRERLALMTKILETPIEALNVCDVLILCEFCKFGFLRPSVLLDRAETFLKERAIENLCAVIEGAGRYLLIRKESNEAMRKLFSRLTSSPLSETDAILVSGALAKLRARPRSGLSLLDFFQWLFQRDNFDPEGVFRKVAGSKRLLALLFSSPMIFPSPARLTELIEVTGMADAMLRIYLETIESSYASSKQLAFLIMRVIGAVISKQPVEIQSQVIEDVFAKKLSSSALHAMVLFILECAHPTLHEQYVARIQSDAPSSQTRTLLFNFCVKHGHQPQEEEMDSFDREIEYMSEL